MPRATKQPNIMLKTVQKTVGRWVTGRRRSKYNSPLKPGIQIQGIVMPRYALQA